MVVVDESSRRVFPVEDDLAVGVLVEERRRIPERVPVGVVGEDGERVADDALLAAASGAGRSCM
jgi:hypothetical protein